MSTPATNTSSEARYKDSNFDFFSAASTSGRSKSTNEVAEAKKDFDVFGKDAYPIKKTRIEVVKYVRK